MFRRIALTLAALVLSLSACSTENSSTEGPKEGIAMEVFGASSTRVINDDLSKLAAELDPPQELQFNNDGSGSLVSQILEGAPADVLITADQRSMDQAVADGTVNDPKPLAYNSMVMVVPTGNPAGIEGLDDLTGDVNLVLCDPSVPCGATSERLAEHNHITPTPVSLENAVGSVLGKITTGEADAGWVYRTDALAAGDDVEVIEIPGAEEFPNTLFVATTKSTDNPDAAEVLMELILSEKIASVLDAHGFTPAD